MTNYSLSNTLHPLSASIYIPGYLKHYYPELSPKTEGSSGFDLVLPETITLSPATPFQLIDFRVVVKPPADHHTILMPRSSTFKNYRLMQANSVGLIDEDYCGIEDTIKMPVVWLPDNEHSYLTIPAGTRLAQIIFMPVVRAKFTEFQPLDKSRGGIGITGR